MVGIDMAAGPTELVVLADETANPDFVAADLISQAEHDPLAWPVLVTPSRTTADVVNRRIENMVQKVATRDISRKSLTSQGFIYLADSEEACIQVANEIAPEHLSLQISNPRRWVEHLTAGAIFVGSLTPVAWGDYWAGANHILPTLGQARFRGPLSVLDFLVPYTIVEVPCQAINLSGDKVRLLARTEGLEAHALSVQLRETGA